MRQNRRGDEHRGSRNRNDCTNGRLAEESAGSDEGCNDGVEDEQETDGTDDWWPARRDLSSGQEDSDRAGPETGVICPPELQPDCADIAEVGGGRANGVILRRALGRQRLDPLDEVPEHLVEQVVSVGSWD
jgi:hypothetical protein